MSGKTRLHLHNARFWSILQRATAASATPKFHPTHRFEKATFTKIQPKVLFSMSSIANQAPSDATDRRSSTWPEGTIEQARFSGPLWRLQESIIEEKVNKWGYLVYRCDYSSDETWAKFMSTLQWYMVKSLEPFKAPELPPLLQLTAKEDRNTLNGASVDQVRNIFSLWVKSDEAKAELGDIPFPGAFRVPRHTYCVHADADVVDSVVNRAPQPPEFDRQGIGYVNFVQLDAHDFYGRDRSNRAPEEEEYDEDEGDEHFVKVPLHYIDAETYTELFNAHTFDLMRLNRREDGVSWG